MNQANTNISGMIEQAQAGDADSLGQLFEHYRPWLRMMAQRTLPLDLQKRTDASDEVQQTFLEAHRDFSNFRGGAEQEFSAWLERILKHNITEAVRRHAMADKRAIGKECPLTGPAADTTSVWNHPAAETSSPSQRVMRGERSIELA